MAIFANVSFYHFVCEICSTTTKKFSRRNPPENFSGRPSELHFSHRVWRLGGSGFYSRTDHADFNQFDRGINHFINCDILLLQNPHAIGNKNAFGDRKQINSQFGRILRSEFLAGNPFTNLRFHIYDQPQPLVQQGLGQGSRQIDAGHRVCRQMHHRKQLRLAVIKGLIRQKYIAQPLTSGLCLM